MIKSGKNPYEIRLDLLELARNILQSQYEADKDSGIRRPPTSEEIILEAEKLNNFISNTHRDWLGILILPVCFVIIFIQDRAIRKNLKLTFK